MLRAQRYCCCCCLTGLTVSTRASLTSLLVRQLTITFSRSTVSPHGSCAARFLFVVINFSVLLSAGFLLRIYTAFATAMLVPIRILLVSEHIEFTVVTIHIYCQLLTVECHTVCVCLLRIYSLCNSENVLRVAAHT